LNGNFKMPKFSKRSQDRLNTTDERLIKLFTEVIKYFDCTILEGKRTVDRQKMLVAQGKSKTMNSKHLTGKAVDVAPYPIDWNDRERFTYFAGFVQGIASQKGFNIRWGGDWDQDKDLKDNSFDDLPHFELKD
tara:strand:- start:1119 stop:1517 length:399 start_codon:yes stop_codon:yes gene_type:complete